MTSHPLARIQIPAANFSEPTLYVRAPESSLGQHGITLKAGESATFDTAFGVFAAGRWSRLTSVADLTASMDIGGHYRLDLVAYANGVDTVVDSVESQSCVSCLNIRDVAAESFFVAVTALGDDVVIRGGMWSTNTLPKRDVRLGVAITTFNRQQYVLDTIDKLVEIEATIPNVREHLRVLVVDNAQNLQPNIPTGAPVRVIPNPNLGGAGGFARGLIEFREEG